MSTGKEAPDAADLGNSIDGSTAGDGAGTRSAATTPGGAAEPETGAQTDLRRQDQAYITPDSEEEGAVGGSDGTTDGQ